MCPPSPPGASVAALSELGTDDDSCGEADGSIVEVPVTAGQTYRILVDSYYEWAAGSDGEGTVALYLDFEASAAPPSPPPPKPPVSREWRVGGCCAPWPPSPRIDDSGGAQVGSELVANQLAVEGITRPKAQALGVARQVQQVRDDSRRTLRPGVVLDQVRPQAP